MAHSRLLDEVVVPQHPRNSQNLQANSPLTVLHSLNSDSDELLTHSQTQPYLRHEPTFTVSTNQTPGFLCHIFSIGVWQNSATIDLDLSDLKYDPSRPRQAEGKLAKKLNDCIERTSPNIFFAWLGHQPPNGFPRDRGLDIAVVPRRLPLAVEGTAAPDSSPSYLNPPDIYAILSCVEHTVSSKGKGFNHNKVHAYAKLNELLKCPMNLSSVVLGVHGQEMALWYADRSGVIEAYIGNNPSYTLNTLHGLSNIALRRDPCVSIFRLTPTRTYKVTLANGTFYGIYGQDDAVIYVSDGIAGKGTLVIPGLPARALTSMDPVKDFNAAKETDRVAIKFSYPSLPWELDHLIPNARSEWKLEWQALQLLADAGVRNVPGLVEHDEHDKTTKEVREVVGLKCETYRIRTILVTQPVADYTLRGAIKQGLDMPLSTLIQVLKDITDAHEDAWKKAGVAHCDISPGNIQILQGRGMLGDWEYAIPIHQLSSRRAINSGTIQTMPPRLAYLMLLDTGPQPEVLSRTPWDEMCSVFMCLIYALADERRDPNDPPLSRNILRATISDRMTTLLTRPRRFCDSYLRHPYKSDTRLVSRLEAALGELFPGMIWTEPRPDADDLEWWDRMHQILDSFCQEPSYHQNPV